MSPLLVSSSYPSALLQSVCHAPSFVKDRVCLRPSTLLVQSERTTKTQNVFWLLESLRNTNGNLWLLRKCRSLCVVNRIRDPSYCTFQVLLDVSPSFSVWYFNWWDVVPQAQIFSKRYLIIRGPVEFPPYRVLRLSSDFPQMQRLDGNQDQQSAPRWTSVRSEYRFTVINTGSQLIKLKAVWAKLLIICLIVIPRASCSCMLLKVFKKVFWYHQSLWFIDYFCFVGSVCY